MNRTKWIALVALLVILGGLVPVQAQDVTIRYFMWDPTFEETERAMADICEAELGITVEMEVIGTPDYWTRLNAMAAADDLPDVFTMSSGFVAEWYDGGLLLNLQDYIDADIMPEAENYFTGLLDVATFDGAAYAFPFAFVETVLFYNQDAFDAAGLDYPSEDGWTWDEFLNAAQALTFDENDDGLIDQYGFWFYGRYAHIESWVYQNGGSLLDETRTRFAPDENAVEALAFLNSLIHEYGVAPTPAEMEGIRQQDVFPLGLAAMWVDGAWNISNNRTQLEGSDLRWAVAPIPMGPGGEEPVAYGWPDLMAISPDSENPDEAWAFIHCMTGPLRTVEMTFPGKIPIYRPTAESDEWLEIGLLPENKDFLLDWAVYTGPTSFTPGWGEWRGYTDGAGLEGQLGEVFNGNMELDAALEAVTEYANSVLERYYPAE
ncbi:MAG: sugar ABC transporter substrate-binding protein [Anaerolineae bacterium]|nr:sugar ABC transporter substrate-binding protein [Anaerolineae bacterium]